ncbi:MAG: DUF488 domain-containing protein [Bryobacterales bacterium]|nr:DUF488 domain-containing protein [Bryobacteraceae bacterium]MDW8353109.1 DUF488 domain-containing protein [Bryobacterales bacterium]
MCAEAKVFTIGHSNHTLEDFLRLLAQHSVTAVADVRSVPMSRLHPQFNRKGMSEALKRAGIAYSFLGKELGGRPRDPSCYVNGQVQYRLVASTTHFKRGIERILAGARKYRIALMCAERDPLDCHRGLLVAPTLEKAGVSVLHILADGRIEAHRETMSRLLERFGFTQDDLFRSREALVEEACARQQERIAYTESPEPGEKVRVAP